MIAPPTLKATFLDVYQPRKLINCADETVRQYLLIIGLFSRHLGFSASIANLNDADVAAFLDAYSRERPRSNRRRSPATVNKARDHLLAIWRYLHGQGLVTKLPDIAPIKVFKRVPTAWDTFQVGELLNSATRLTGDVMPGVSRADFFVALFLVAYDTGLRKGALLGLRRSDVDLRRGHVLARAETQKQKANQLLTICEQTSDAVRELWLPDRELLFEFPKKLDKTKL